MIQQRSEFYAGNRVENVPVARPGSRGWRNVEKKKKKLNSQFFVVDPADPLRFLPNIVCFPSLCSEKIDQSGELLLIIAGIGLMVWAHTISLSIESPLDMADSRPP